VNPYFLIFLGCNSLKRKVCQGNGQGHNKKG